MGRGGGAGGGGGRGMSGGGSGRGMTSGRGGGSAGRGGSGGRGGGIGSPGRSGGMGGMGGAPGPQRRRSGSGFGAGMAAGMMGASMSRRRRSTRRAPGGMVPRGGGGCLSGFMFPLLIVIIILIVAISSCTVMNSGSEYEGDGITRTKLDASSCTESSEWIDDEVGWLQNESTVKKAMQTFYNETGVQPYLVITDNINGKVDDITSDDLDAYAESVYDSLFNDEGHMVLVFVEYETSEYMYEIYTGNAADGVIDSSARNYIGNLLQEYYYDSSLSDDEYFANVFTDSAKNLMQDYNQSSRTRTIVIIIVVIGVILIIVLILARRLSESRAKEAERTKEILDTPIGESSSDEDLEKKYGDPAGGGHGSGGSGGTSGTGNA